MTGTRWAVDDPLGASLDIGGHTYSSIGAPVMCNLVCSSIRRHVHIDHCRTDGDGPCDSSEVQHITERISPEPNTPKDAVTHSLYWKRMGSSRAILSGSFLTLVLIYWQVLKVNFPPNSLIYALRLPTRPIHP
jgi:hypothetical protein